MKSLWRHRIYPKSGLTLLELLITLVVLIALAGMIIPLLNGFQIDVFGDGSVKKSPERIATEATMQRIRDVIMGTPTQPGVWADVGQRPESFPGDVADLFSASVPAHMAVPEFDPVTGVGWRGPYFVQATGVNAEGKSTLVDAWGNPIVIQIPDAQAVYARLVSSGANQELETPPDQAVLTLADMADNDDIVMFLRVADTRY